MSSGASVITATVDIDELEALNRDRDRLHAAERIWKVQFAGESLIEQVDALLENGDLEDFLAELADTVDLVEE